jgi:SAM-dependent methyltransferase
MSYSRLPDAEAIHLVDTWPQVHDRTSTSGVDAHYFYANGWAMRRIVAQQPRRHVDIGSQTIFANLLGTVVPVVFVDYRPLHVKLTGLESLGADILTLPFADGAIESLSCLHVAEHVGLGRYGDSLNPQGTRQAARELSRALAPGSNLYFAVPVGRPRLCFNGCRIHTADTICQYFANLELIEFSGVHDNGQFVEKVRLAEFSDSEYACGMFWFKKLGHSSKHMSSLGLSVTSSRLSWHEIAGNGEKQKLVQQT